MRQPLQLTYDPDCTRCEGIGLTTSRLILKDGSGKPYAGSPIQFKHMCDCVKMDATQPRQPCPDCGGLGVLEGVCVGCGLPRPA